jgi:hypothetical protein
MPTKLTRRFEAPSSPARNIALLDLTAKVATGFKELRDVQRRLETRLQAIRDDPELTPEQRKYREEKAYSEGRVEWRRRYAELEAGMEAAEEAAQVEYTARRIDPGAQARARSLLDRGLTPSQVLDRARTLGDDEMVVALRTELLYFAADGRFADAQETIAACNQALAAIAMGAEQENNQALVDLEDARPKAKAVGEFVGKAVHGIATPRDRISLGYALGEGRDGDGDAT